MVWETASIPFTGGLDLYDNLQLLLEQPNKAVKLQNFEPAVNGGYRRINGYARFGTANVPGTGPIQGVVVYKGVAVAREGKLYHSTDGTAWTEIVGVTLTTSPDAIVQGTLYNVDGNTETMVVTDGVSKPHYITLGGDGTFTVVVPTATNVAGAKNPVIIGERVAFAVDTRLVTSNRFNISEFDEGFEANLLMPIVAINAFRERLIIFGRHRIKQALDIDDHTRTSIRDITYNIGCVAGGSVQEVGGDLIFLAPDGLRTVSATERIDDIELSVLSRPIRPLTDAIVARLQDYRFSSTVIRATSQYRLYAFDTRQNDAAEELQFGIIASLVYGETGTSWQFAQTRGVPAVVLGDGVLDDDEVAYFGTRTGIVHTHNVGNDFNGKKIRAFFYTPFFALGDLSLRKTIHKVQPYVSAEDRTDEMLLVLRYNYDDEYTHQPTPYVLEPFVRPALYSRTEYSLGVYGAVAEGARDIAVEGSGHTVQLRFISNGGSPFVIQGFNVDFSYGGKI